MNINDYLVYQDNVFHCGELKPELRKNYSLEGNLLSVSPFPDVWKRINRINSNQIIKLAADYFVDVIKVKNDNDLLLKIKNFAINSHLVKEVTYYSVSYFDDELEAEMETLIQDFNEAKADSESYETELKTKTLLESEKKLDNFFEQSNIPVCLTEDFIIMYYFINELKQYKFFWNEKLDILNYSAPRGGVFNFDVNKDIYEIMTINEFSKNYLIDFEY
tara:strand:- start:16285 stop:16941 length:657 start_codon:yes stop_codon:yes gene_type:complete